MASSGVSKWGLPFTRRGADVVGADTYVVLVTATSVVGGAVVDAGNSSARGLSPLPQPATPPTTSTASAAATFTPATLRLSAARGRRWPRPRRRRRRG